MSLQLYFATLEESLSKLANPTRAAGAKKYMRDQFDYFGISSPERKEALRLFLAKNGLPEINSIDEFAMLCWNHPNREMQYCCMEIMFRLRKQLTPKHIPLFEKLMQSKGWWDTVDFIAPSLVGYVFMQNPDIIDEVSQRWQNHECKWMRRASILYQLKYKQKTDAEKLFATCAALAHENEFFIRKAIGWALREYSKTNPEAVRKFVAETPLSGLSQREALKRMP